jgi:hypothetical protein
MFTGHFLAIKKEKIKETEHFKFPEIIPFSF